MPAYDATKAAVLALARHTALEGAPRGIRANSILPGVVDTPLGAASAPPQSRDRRRIPLPLGRLGTPWDVAYAAIFLLSGESSYVTAQSLIVDGGTTVLALGS
jgi:NAD(P)-dependent dehydrogenase (short-subunit alcohol dehydrogenase family)